MLVFAKDGKIAHETEYVDLSTLLGQLGKGSAGQKVRAVEPAPSAPLEVVVAAPGEAPKNVSVLKKLYEASQKRDHKSMAAALADGGIISNAHDPADITRPDLVKMLPSRDKVFVDQGSVVKQCINAGEFAACEYEWTATWKGADMGVMPTGKTGTIHELDVVRVKDGKIVRLDGYGSSLEFAVAFGLPLPAAVGANKPPAKPEPKPLPKAPPTELPKQPPKPEPKPAAK
jgi:ketosteroid isomerase-like protein